MRNHIAFFLAISLSAAASAQVSELPPAGADDIAGAVSDCWNAVGASKVDRASLEAAGWKAVPIDGPRGDKPLSAYSRQGRHATILIADTGQQPLCSVVARVPLPDDRGKAVLTIQKALVALDSQVKTTRDGDSIFFLALPKLAMADDFGSKAKPAIRIVVGYKDSEKK